MTHLFSFFYMIILLIKQIFYTKNRERKTSTKTELCRSHPMRLYIRVNAVVHQSMRLYICLNEDVHLSQFGCTLVSKSHCMLLTLEMSCHDTMACM